MYLYQINAFLIVEGKPLPVPHTGLYASESDDARSVVDEVEGVYFDNKEPNGKLLDVKIRYVQFLGKIENFNDDDTGAVPFDPIEPPVASDAKEIPVEQQSAVSGQQSASVKTDTPVANVENVSPLAVQIHRMHQAICACKVCKGETDHEKLCPPCKELDTLILMMEVSKNNDEAGKKGVNAELPTSNVERRTEEKP